MRPFVRARAGEAEHPRQYSLYRWHVLDSTGVRQDLKVTVQALGVWPYGRHEPHASFPELPPLPDRWND